VNSTIEMDPNQFFDLLNRTEVSSSDSSSDTESSSDDTTSSDTVSSDDDIHSILPIRKSGGPLEKIDKDPDNPPFPPTGMDQSEELKNSLLSGEEFEFFTKNARLVRMSLSRRRVISGCQWTCKILLYILAIMALIDIGIAPSSVNNYIYLNSQTAIAAGYPFHGTIYGGPWPYFIIQTVSFGFMCLSFFLEWRCYPVRSMGLDLKWDVIPVFLADDQYVVDSIMQARNSLSPFGAAYDNYVYFMLFQGMMFFLVFFHIFIEGWNMMFFAVLYVIFGFWSIVIDIFYMVKIYFYAGNEYRRYQKLKERSSELRKDTSDTLKDKLKKELKEEFREELKEELKEEFTAEINRKYGIRLPPSPPRQSENEREWISGWASELGLIKKT